DAVLRAGARPGRRRASPVVADVLRCGPGEPHRRGPVRVRRAAVLAGTVLAEPAGAGAARAAAAGPRAFGRFRGRHRRYRSLHLAHRGPLPGRPFGGGLAARGRGRPVAGGPGSGHGDGGHAGRLSGADARRGAGAHLVTGRGRSAAGPVQSAGPAATGARDCHRATRSGSWRASQSTTSAWVAQIVSGSSHSSRMKSAVAGLNALSFQSLKWFAITSGARLP